MDSKGGSLPLMPEPLSPVSMKQPPEPLTGRKSRGDMGADPALLMDKAAVQLAATLQDSVLQKMTSHNHSHERLKDLTSRVLNGDQDKLPKMCAAEPPTLKGAEAPPTHGSPQRKGASPELKLKITRRVANGKSPRFEPCCAEGPNLAMAPADVMLGAPNKGKDGQGRKRRPVKPKPQPKPGCSPAPLQPPVSVQPEESSASANKVPVPLPEVKGTEKEDPPLQICFSVGDVVWTKVSGYPWWPCIVTTDPELNEHFKQKQKVNSRTGLLYHVQYFGDAPERGYIFEKSMVSFNGEEQYQELCQGNKQPASRVIHRETTPSVPRKLRGQWNMGIAQAKQAASMALEERMAMFTFVYDSDGPHLNPRVLEELRPAPAKASGEEEQGPQEASRLGPPPLPTVQPAPPTPDPKDSTSAGKKAPTPKTKTTTAKQGRRKTTASPLKKKAKVLSLSKEGPHQSLSQDPATLTTETELLESQKKNKSKLKSQPPTKRVRKTSKIISSAADMTEPPKKAPKMKSRPITEESKSKGLKAQKKSSKRALDATEEAKEQQPKKKRKLGKVGEKQETPASDSSSTTKQRKTRKTNAEIKKGTKGSKASLSEVNVPEKPKRVWKRKQDSGDQSAPAQPKKRRSPPSPEPEGSGSEGRPESPSDSIDGTKKNGGAKKESVCQVCEHAGEDVLPCEGQCCGTFHLQCLGLSLKPKGKLLCHECSSGVHLCFSCKRSEGEVRRCSVQHCGRFYHEACARLSALTVFDNKGFRCPLHTCLNCHYSCRSKPKSTKGKMMRCVRCPVAYHTGDLCVAAGSEMLSPNAIVCTNHFAAKKGYSQHSHVNVCWCFVCSKGGRLLCCESCPAAFHPDCLNIAMPDGSWFCNDCRAGKKPKYNDIIWVKLGLYRWWPAEIRHPRNIPTNIQHLRHEIGEFPVFFFGSKDYFWTHQGRVFPYIEGDRGYKHSKTGIGKIFKRALMEAEARFKEIKMEREAKETQENNRKPSPYKYIKINKPYGKVQVYTADVSEIPKCNCKPTDEKPCGFESECLNRMLMYECHPQVCPSGERCCNQDFTKRLYPETKVIRTAGKGWGLLALRDVKKGEFVNEYVGELIDEEECRARIKYAQDNDITHFYMLTIYKDRIIDAGPKGNYSRFMNHSCQPNCETQKWTVNGDTRVGLFAVCDIPAGTELTFNYNLDCLGNEKTVCRCGAPNCSGFLGDRPKNSNGQTAEPKGKKVKKKPKKRRSEGRKPSEDECFRCGDGGQLVLCDKKSCTKAYHLSCLDRTKRPFGRWDCPWHHCDVCGKNSEAFCQLCPNSFCKAHQEGALCLWPSTGQLCCQEHEQPEAATPEIPRPPKGCRKGQEV